MIPTLEIIHPDLPGAKMIINEADFDPSRHQRYREPKTRKRSPEQSPNLSEDQPPATPDLSQEQSPEPISDLPEALSPEQIPNGSEDQPSPTPDLPEAQPAPYTQSDLEAKNITALRAIAAEKRIPRRMKLSRDELLQAILATSSQ